MRISSPPVPSHGRVPAWFASYGFVMALLACTSPANSGAAGAWPSDTVADGSSDASGDSAYVGDPPQLAVAIEGSAALPQAACSMFAPDTTGGQTKYHKQLLLKNNAAPGLTPLCLKWSIDDKNNQLAIVAPSAPPTASGCGAEWQAGVVAGSAGISFDVAYTPTGAAVGQPVKITIVSNDPNHPSTTLCFGIAGQSSGCSIEPSAFTFTNVTAANPQTACFALHNAGTAPLQFAGAAIDPANGQYTITDEPNAGDAIAGAGTAGNPDGNQALKVCVRYTPDASPGNEMTSLVIKWQGTSAQCSAALDATNAQAAATFSLTCPGSPGKPAFVFPKPVAGSAKCTLCNNGPPPMKVMNAAVQADVPAEAAKVAANYKAAITDSFGAPQSLFALSSGGCVDLVVDYTPQGGQAGPKATMSFTYSSVGLTDQGTIPIQAAP